MPEQKGPYSAILSESGAFRWAIPYFDRTLFAEGSIGLIKRALLLFTMCVVTPQGVAAQNRDSARADYFRAVAGFFNLPESEIAILGDWETPADEIPVVLFMARRAGVSPEALVALRGSGQSWTRLADRYGVSAATLHAPIRDDAPTGALLAVYLGFRGTPVSEWPGIRLSDSDIVALVNVRVLAQSLGLSAEAVLRDTSSATSFVEHFARLKR